MTDNTSTDWTKWSTLHVYTSFLITCNDYVRRTWSSFCFFFRGPQTLKKLKKYELQSEFVFVDNHQKVCKRMSYVPTILPPWMYRFPNINDDFYELNRIFLHLVRSSRDGTGWKMADKTLHVGNNRFPSFWFWILIKDNVWPK